MYSSERKLRIVQREWNSEGGMRNGQLAINVKCLTKCRWTRGRRKIDDIWTRDKKSDVIHGKGKEMEHEEGRMICKESGKWMTRTANGQENNVK